MLNNKGKLIEKSTKGGNSLENIEGTLNPGAYYVKVQSKGNEDADYTLSLGVGSGSEQEDKVGNNRKKAYKFGALKNNERFEEFVGKSDQRDFYQFKVEEKTDINIELGGLSGNADLYLLNNKGKLIEKSTQGRNNAEDIERTLNPGAYYVKVQSKGNQNADYTLSLDVGSGSKNLEKYQFTYYYSGSQDNERQDYYSGYFYAPKGTYEVGSYYDFNKKTNEASANGKYYISSSSKAGAKAKDGEVYLESYYDLETNKEYVPYYASEDLASGASGMGSEEDFIDFEKDEDVIELKREGFFGADYYLANIVKEARTSKSGDYQIDALLSPYKWGTNTITYSFYDNDSGPYYGAERDVGEISDKVQEDIRHILENIYEPLSDLDFVEVADTSNSYGLIRIMKSSNPNYAY
ncbi:MAG: pre-peptidase C-terminal domain-containing protein, partial [Trichodesmium sp. St16_bin4-tuft]|nr:pre-peptidase C-terminal domain-containing protein [Trichodesmium sp. St16_bin4-tuft]